MLPKMSMFLFLENQSLSGLSYDDSTRYTAQVLVEAVGRALTKAEIK